MDEKEVGDALDLLRVKLPSHPFDKIANYIQANMDEFIECYTRCSHCGEYECDGTCER